VFSLLFNFATIHRQSFRQLHTKAISFDMPVLITFETSFVGIFVLVIRHDSANTDVSTMFNESTEPLSHVDDYFVAI